MTEEEFAKLFPNLKWPQTFEGKNGAYTKLTQLPKLTPGFSNPPITKDSIPPMSVGELRNRVPTSRERMFDFINEKFYGGEGVGSERNKYARNLGSLLDFTPIGMLNQAYDTGRELGEGRFTDAAMSSGLSYLPALRKSRINGLFNPKPKPQRGLFEDYPKGPELNEEGYITKDIEGRPLNAPYIAGRTRADEPDRALSPIAVQRVGEHAIEGPIEKVPSSQLRGPGSYGQTELMFGLPMAVKVLDTLPKDKMDIVTAHEVGHVIDALSDQIPTKGLEKELDFNYSALRTGEERKYILSTPEDFGYREKRLADRERMAEAIRAYMADPNYLKTIAPNTAARIREHVHNSPELSKIIQFNSLAAGATGAALAGQSEDANAKEAPQESRAQPNALGGAYSIPGLPIPFGLVSGATRSGPGIVGLTKALSQRGNHSQVPKNEKFRGLVRALVDLEARQKPRLRGGPR